MSESLAVDPESVEAELNYLLYEGKRPVNYNMTPPPGVPQRSGTPLPTRVKIWNARRRDEAFSLDRHGFELRAHRSAVTNFADESAVRGSYYAETAEVLARVTGAEKVIVFDHTLRLARPGHDETGVREPVRYVHNDQTVLSGPRRVRDHLPADEAERRLKNRFAIINVWRPIGEPVLNAPLAMCDARSIEADDLVATDLVYPDKVGEVYSFVPSPRHRWFYFPRVQPDEVVLLKIYDSRRDTARLTAHSAFDDPSSAAGSPRRSIELRTLVFFPAAD